MKNLTEDHNFQRGYEKLKQVTLNPDRHTAENAYAHCELVVNRVHVRRQLSWPVRDN